MPMDMPQTRRLLARIRRRAAARAIWRDSGRALLLASGLTLALILVGKALGWSWASGVAAAWPILVGGATIGVIFGAAIGLSRTPKVLAAATLADRFAGRSDDIRAAMELGSRSKSDPFVGMLMSESERVAGGLSSSRIVPLRFGGTWPVAAGVLGIAIVCAIWVPMRRPDPAASARRLDPGAAALGSEVARAADEVRAVSESVGSAVSPREAERFAELERELREGLVRSEDARAEASLTASEIAERVEREAEENRVASERLRELASAASERARESSADAQSTTPGSPSEPLDPRLERLMESLASGDLSSAADAARELEQQAPTMTTEERARFAEQLDALAEALDESVAPEIAAAPESTEPAVTNPESTAPEPAESEPAESEAGSRPASENGSETPRTNDPIEQREEAQAEAKRERESSIDERGTREAERDARSIADAARDAAEELRRPPVSEEPPPRQDPQNPEQGDASPEENSKSPEQSDSKQSEQQKGRDQTQGEGQEGSNQPGERQGESKEQQQGERTGQQQGERPGQQDGQQGRQQGGEQQGQGEERGERGSQDQQQGEGSQDQQAQGTKQGAAGEESQRRGERTEAKSSEGDQRGEARERGDSSREDPRGKQADEAARAEQAEQQGSKQQGDEQPDPARKGAGQKPAGEDERNLQGEQQGAQQGEQQGGEQQGGQQQTGAGQDRETEPKEGTGLERLQRSLREASERAADSRRQREGADRLRRLSEELASGVNPDAPRSGAPAGPDASGGPMREPGRLTGAPPSAIDDVRVPRPTTPSGPGRVAAERPSDRQAPIEVAPITPGALREAASGVERAIEQQAVPDRRSDLVRRVFERYRARAESGSAKPGGAERP